MESSCVTAALNFAFLSIQAQDFIEETNVRDDDTPEVNS